MESMANLINSIQSVVSFSKVGISNCRIYQSTWS